MLDRHALRCLGRRHVGTTCLKIPGEKTCWIDRHALRCLGRTLIQTDTVDTLYYVSMLIPIASSTNSCVFT